MSKINLILVRHGKSEWNALGLWTGLTDVELTEEGREEARRTARTLEGLGINQAHVSDLKRAKETLAEIQKSLDTQAWPVKVSSNLNERDYGVYTGKNKWEIQKEVGEAKFLDIRRGWDCSIPEGETLKDVYNRTVPYYEKEILPDLQAGKVVLVVAHGNSLRALAKHLEGISDEDVGNLEITTGEAWCYCIDSDGKMLSKEVRSANSNKV